MFCFTEKIKIRILEWNLNLKLIAKLLLFFTWEIPDKHVQMSLNPSNFFLQPRFLNCFFLSYLPLTVLTNPLCTNTQLFLLIPLRFIEQTKEKVQKQSKTENNDKRQSGQKPFPPSPSSNRWTWQCISYLCKIIWTLAGKGNPTVTHTRFTT